MDTSDKYVATGQEAKRHAKTMLGRLAMCAAALGILAAACGAEDDERTRDGAASFGDAVGAAILASDRPLNVPEYGPEQPWETEFVRPGARDTYAAGTLASAAASAAAPSSAGEVPLTTLTGTGGEVNAGILPVPVPGMTVPAATGVLVQHGETDQLAGMPESEYTPVVDARTMLIDALIARTLSLSPMAEIDAGAGSTLTPAAHDGGFVLIRSGETDQSAGVSEWYMVFVGLQASPTPAEVSASATILTPAAHKGDFVLVRSGETDQSAGMPEWDLVPVGDLVSHIPADVTGPAVLGETDQAAFGVK